MRAAGRFRPVSSSCPAEALRVLAVREHGNYGPFPIPPGIHGVRWPTDTERRTEALAEAILEAWRQNRRRRWDAQPRPPKGGARIPERLTWQRTAPGRMEFSSRPLGGAPVILRRTPSGWEIWRTTTHPHKREFGGCFPSWLWAAASASSRIGTGIYHHRFVDCYR